MCALVRYLRFMDTFSRVSDQKDVSPVYIIVEIHHSGRSFLVLYYPSLLLCWMFEHDYLDTCCLVSYMYVFDVFVFALVQRN